MAIRVSQRQIYSTMINGMNSSLSSLMNLHEQNTSQKRINRPSDDPFGAAQVLNSRATLSSISQYKDNLNMAKGWITQAESALGLVDEQLIELQALMEQGATGTLTAQQRQNLSFKAQGIFDEILALSNTKFGGRYIFSGHKTDTTAYAKTMGVTSRDAGLSDVQFKVTGDNSSTVNIQFTSSGPITGQPSFRYSTDAGQTWQTGSWDGTGTIMQCGSVHVEPVIKAPGTNINVTAVDTTNDNENNNGTWLYVRPTAEYLGDTNDANVVQTYPLGGTNTGQVIGNFSRDVTVRVDNLSGGRIAYSYSMDNGSTWTTSNAPAGPPAELAVPGGVLTLSSTPAVGEQYVIKPYRADLELTIGNNSSIVINNVGKDVFGGIYNVPFSGDGAQPVEGQNVFELIGEAITYLESNNQQGCQEVLGSITDALSHVLKFRTQLGAKANRIEAAESQLDFLQYDEEGLLSTVEDADLSEILSKLSQQQLAYNSVLKSSSMIMQMSLMNFL